MRATGEEQDVGIEILHADFILKPRRARGAVAELREAAFHMDDGLFVLALAPTLAVEIAEDHATPLEVGGLQLARHADVYQSRVILLDLADGTE